MAPKRKSSAIAEESAGVDASGPRRSSRRLKGAEPEPSAASAMSRKGHADADASPTLTKPANKAKPAAKPARKGKRAQAKSSSAASQPDASRDGATKAKAANKGTAAGTAQPAAAEGSDRRYWLMKAEPEPRLENGINVSFSIDDLAAKTEPEPWDGIRNYVARNNLRAMKKGDLAFFYHSNCKEPGIIGTMEIVQEHSPDLSAHDPKAPYYDASSKPEDPKWSVVHVEFRSKFAGIISLKELREMGGPGKPLQDMQMLKQTRLSVSSVSPAEWEHLMSVAASKGPISGK